MCRKLCFLVSVVGIFFWGGVAYGQCDIPPGQTVTVSGAETCGQMNIAGTLVIESTGSVTCSDRSTLNGAGATITVNGGSFHCTARFNLGQGGDGYINVNGGTFTVDGTWKFADDPDGVHRMWINEGIVHSGDIELRGDRDAIIYVGGGVLRVTTIPLDNQYYDPNVWIAQGWLQPADDYDEIVIEPNVGYTEITAVSVFPRAQFETAASGAEESVTPALLTVTLSQPVAETVTVDYAVTGGTATRGTDYILADGTLTFDTDQTAQQISIDVVDDGVDENDETIVVTLSNPTGGALLGSRAEHTYTIVDPRPAVQFASSSSSGSEADTAAQIPVVLSEAQAVAVTVDYAVTGGSATAGVDYSLANGTLTFAPGVTSQNIEITVVDDTQIEDPETIILTLSNPTGPDVRLGTNTQHTFTIIDDEEGLYWEGKTWYYSNVPSRIFINADGDLEWTPEKGGQYVTRIPEQRFSQTGDKVEIKYWYMSDGKDDCPPNSCYNCTYCDDDITCIAGTSDFRFGLFQADGEYITSDGFDTSSSVFEGYKGYNWRFGPHLQAYPTRWEQCGTGEVHKTGMFAKKPQGSSNLMTINEGEMDYIPGFELPPGEWSLLTISIERLSSSNVRLSITLNGRTHTDTDGSSSGQPQKIDVFGIHMRNGRPYSRLVLQSLQKPEPKPADFNKDCLVDDADLKVLADDWLLQGSTNPVGTPPNNDNLVVRYAFDETSGSTAADSSANGYNGDVQLISSGEPASGAWDSDGYDGAGCINFDGSAKVVVPQAAFSGISSAVTVSLWVNGDPARQPDQDWGMPFHGGTPSNDRLLHTHIPTKYGTVMLESGSYNAQRLYWDGAANADWAGQWNHYAFTLDSNQGFVKIYCNGEKKAEGGASLGVGGIQSFTIGCGIFASSGTVYEYLGKIDDFRIYNYALSDDEVLYVANDGEKLTPPDSPANLYEDDVINFKDFADFASQWLGVCE